MNTMGTCWPLYASVQAWLRSHPSDSHLSVVRPLDLFCPLSDSTNLLLLHVIDWNIWLFPHELVFNQCNCPPVKVCPIIFAVNRVSIIKVPQLLCAVKLTYRWLEDNNVVSSLNNCILNDLYKLFIKCSMFVTDIICSWHLFNFSNLFSANTVLLLGGCYFHFFLPNWLFFAK